MWIFKVILHNDALGKKEFYKKQIVFCKKEALFHNCLCRIENKSILKKYYF